MTDTLLWRGFVVSFAKYKLYKSKIYKYKLYTYKLYKSKLYTYKLYKSKLYKSKLYKSKLYDAIVSTCRLRQFKRYLVLKKNEQTKKFT